MWKSSRKGLTMPLSQISAINVTMHLLRQAIWEPIWKRTVEKSQTNATSVTLHPLMQALCGGIWKYTVEKSLTNAISATLHPHRQAMWGHIWKYMLVESKKSATSVSVSQAGNLKTHGREKPNKSVNIPNYKYIKYTKKMLISIWFFFLLSKHSVTESE